MRVGETDEVKIRKEAEVKIITEGEEEEEMIKREGADMMMM